MPQQAATPSDRGRTAISAIAHHITSFAGSGAASVLVIVFVTGWVVAGVAWGFAEPWHRWLHTIGTLITLVMLFVIQHTTNRESRATLIKLDELIRVHGSARSAIMSVENAEPATQERIEGEMHSHPDSAPRG